MMEEVGITPIGASRMSLREQLLALPRGRPVPLSMSAFPYAPQVLYMRSPKAEWLAAWEQKGVQVGRRNRISIKQNRYRKAELVQHMLCDVDGILIFTKDDFPEIMNMDAGVVGHWFLSALEIAGVLRDEEDDTSDEDEELEGN